MNPLDPREQIVFNYIKEWAKTHKEAIRHTFLLKELKPKLNEATLRNALLRLMIKGYIRENTKGGNYKSFTMIRNG